MGNTPQLRILREALDALGSESRLAFVLGVPLAQVRTWLSGEAHIPPSAFFGSLDVLVKGGRDRRPVTPEGSGSGEWRR